MGIRNTEDILKNISDEERQAQREILHADGIKVLDELDLKDKVIRLRSSITYINELNENFDPTTAYSSVDIALDKDSVLKVIDCYKIESKDFTDDFDAFDIGATVALYGLIVEVLDTDKLLELIKFRIVISKVKTNKGFIYCINDASQRRRNIDKVYDIVEDSEIDSLLNEYNKAFEEFKDIDNNVTEDALRLYRNREKRINNFDKSYIACVVILMIEGCIGLPLCDIHGLDTILNWIAGSTIIVEALWVVISVIIVDLRRKSDLKILDSAELTESILKVKNILSEIRSKLENTKTGSSEELVGTFGEKL